MTFQVLSARHAKIPLPRYSTAGQVERFLYPSQRHLTPTHCGHCKARLLLSRVPTADEPLVDVECLYCARVVCELASDNLRPRVPSHALPVEEVRRGRPPKPMPAPRTTPVKPCPSCGAAMTATHGVQHCLDCEKARRFDAGVQGRLLEILEAGGEPLHSQDLRDLLGVSDESLRTALTRVRQRGYPVVRSRGGRYSLEVRP